MRTVGAVAFLSGYHPRLGATSSVRCLPLYTAREILTFASSSFWHFKCKEHIAAVVVGEKRQNKEAAEADLRQHEEAEHAGEHVGKVTQLHI
jgi:hypothetical protein